MRSLCAGVDTHLYLSMGKMQIHWNLVKTELVYMKILFICLTLTKMFLVLASRVEHSVVSVAAIVVGSLKKKKKSVCLYSPVPVSCLYYGEINCMKIACQSNASIRSVDIIIFSSQGKVAKM